MRSHSLEKEESQSNLLFPCYWIVRAIADHFPAAFFGAAELDAAVLGLETTEVRGGVDLGLGAEAELDDEDEEDVVGLETDVSAPEEVDFVGWVATFCAGVEATEDVEALFVIAEEEMEEEIGGAPATLDVDEEEEQ